HLKQHRHARLPLHPHHPPHQLFDIGQHDLDLENLRLRHHPKPRHTGNAPSCSSPSRIRSATSATTSKYGIKLDSIMNGPGNGTERHDALLAALDDHNATGRLREESEEADLAATKSKQDVENSTPAEEEKYSEHLRTE